MFSFINVHADPQLLTSPQDLSLPVYVLVAVNRQQPSRCLKRPIRSDPPLRALKSLLTDHQRKGPTSTRVDKGADMGVRGRTGYFGCAAPHPPGKTHNSPKQPRGFAAVQERLYLGLYQKDTKFVITVNVTHSSVACLPWNQPSSEELPHSRRESRDSWDGCPVPEHVDHPDPALEKHQALGCGGTGTLVVCSIRVQLLQRHLVSTSVANGEHGICHTKWDHWDISSCTLMLEAEGSPEQT